MQYMDDAKRARIPLHYRCKGCGEPIARHTRIDLKRCFAKIKKEATTRKVSGMWCAQRPAKASDVERRSASSTLAPSAPLRASEIKPPC